MPNFREDTHPSSYDRDSGSTDRPPYSTNSREISQNRSEPSSRYQHTSNGYGPPYGSPKTESYTDASHGVEEYTDSRVDDRYGGSSRPSTYRGGPSSRMTDDPRGGYESRAPQSTSSYHSRETAPDSRIQPDHGDFQPSRTASQVSTFSRPSYPFDENSVSGKSPNVTPLPKDPVPKPENEHAFTTIVFGQPGLAHFKRARNGMIIAGIDADDASANVDGRNRPRGTADVGFAPQVDELAVNTIGGMRRGNIKFRMLLGRVTFESNSSDTLRTLHTNEMAKAGIGPTSPLINSLFKTQFTRSVASEVETILKAEGFELLSMQRDVVKITYYDLGLKSYAIATANKVGPKLKLQRVSPIPTRKFFTFANAGQDEADADFHVVVKHPSRHTKPSSFVNRLVNAITVEETPKGPITNFTDPLLEDYVKKLEWRKVHKIFKRNHLLVKVSNALLSGSSQLQGWEIRLTDTFLDRHAEYMFDVAQKPRPPSAPKPLYEEASDREFKRTQEGMKRSFMRFIQFADRLTELVQHEQQQTRNI